jgi:signal peptidase II
MGVASDQFCKGWAFAADGASERQSELVPGLRANLQARNFGAILSLEGEGTFLLRNGLAIAGFIAAGIVLRWALVLDRDRWCAFDAFAGGLLLGGALGNQVDRLTLGYVRDHLTVWFRPHEIFNLGDVLMVLGAFFLLSSFIVRSRPFFCFPSVKRCRTCG